MDRSGGGGAWWTGRRARAAAVGLAAGCLTAGAAGAQAARPAAAPPDSATVERRVEALLARMTADEKVGMLGGVDFFDVPGVPRLGVPRLGTADSPFGVRAQGSSTVYAGGIGLAAAWDTALARRVGRQLGRDARARGKHYSLGPGVNIYRSPLNGRNFEYYGEDPWLAARTAVAFIRGVQSEGVSSTVKHYLGNNSEYARNTSDSRIGERALRELYLPAFEAAIKEAEVGAVMPAYNLVNGAYMTANRRLLTEVAKGEFGFRGVMMSDWGAVHSALGAADGGTDLEMPGPDHFNRDSLGALVRSGAVAQATVDDKVRRLLRNVVRFGWMERGSAPDASVPRYNVEGRRVALEGAREAMVLLKNANNTLPFDRGRVRTVAVIGPNAFPAVILGGGSATVPPFHAVSPLEGVAEFLGAGATVLHARGVPSFARMAAGTAFTTAPNGGRPGVTVEEFGDGELRGAPAATRVERVMETGRPFDLGALAASEDPLDFSGGGGPARRVPGMRFTGYYTPAAPGPHLFFVQQSGFGATGARLFVDGRKVADSWDAATAMVAQATVPLAAGPHRVVLEFHTDPGGFGAPFVRVGVGRPEAWVDSGAVALARRADAVVLAVGFSPESESEAWDRTFALPPGQDALARAVLAANPRTVVVVNSGGAVDMAGWVDQAPALVEAWYPGELGGQALAELLFGAQNFSGHLPASFERRLEDNPTSANYYPEPRTPGDSLRVPYREGVFVGYRGYDRSGTKPLFPFGHGLSYTTFRYANLTVRPAAASAPDEPRYTVAFDVTNAGQRAGAAVAQVYVSDGHARAERPAKELKGYARVALAPGETRRVTVPLDLRSLAYYDEAGRQWRADAGTFTVRVGGSSAELPLAAPLVLPRTATRAVSAR